ncbi:hypothetical protein WJX81_003029 [Elliptochloris bilobata]|uniref:Metallo-beta-lactamase domain-containing protein n=1 Tax=Elliptochloris bilobata TaxID=381761 RepID=A0AAW1RIA2_9CHLO
MQIAPHIDAVLISHHYDHLDAASMAYLHRRFGAALAWFVPPGLRKWFARCGIAHARELDWWQQAPLGDQGA